MPFLYAALTSLSIVLLTTGTLHALPRLGALGQRLSRHCAHAPLLDVVVSLLLWVPWVVGVAAYGWWGLPGAVVGQAVALETWVFLHERAHRDAAKGPRIKKFLNQRVGVVRNYLGLYATAVAVPVFVCIRLAELFVWPPLAWLMRFPAYKQREWVNCSRHKFDGLVGHDRIWCLYCDWMTGVYALGAEMLRNVETVWCPIRFDDDAKCANCRIDFPDLNGGPRGWVDADKDMAAVVERMAANYPDDRPVNDWWGHPARAELTIEGEAPAGSSDTGTGDA